MNSLLSAPKPPRPAAIPSAADQNQQPAHQQLQLKKLCRFPFITHHQPLLGPLLSSMRFPLASLVRVPALGLTSPGRVSDQSIPVVPGPTAAVPILVLAWQAGASELQPCVPGQAGLAEPVQRIRRQISNSGPAQASAQAGQGTTAAGAQAARMADSAEAGSTSPTSAGQTAAEQTSGQPEQTTIAQPPTTRSPQHQTSTGISTTQPDQSSASAGQTPPRASSARGHSRPQSILNPSRLRARLSRLLSLRQPQPHPVPFRLPRPLV